MGTLPCLAYCAAAVPLSSAQSLQFPLPSLLVAVI